MTFSTMCYSNKSHTHIYSSFLPNILSTLRARSELLPKRLSNAIANLIKNKYEADLPTEDLMIDMRNVLEKDIEDLLNYVVDENRKFFDNLRSS